MRVFLAASILCGIVAGLILVLLLVAGDGPLATEAVIALTLAGGTLSLASAAWGSAFRRW